MDVACRYRREYGAAGFRAVMAVVEFALPEVRAELDKGMVDFLGFEMMQTELLQSGGVDDVAVRIEVVEPGEGGGVFAGIQCFRYFACFQIDAREKCIDDA